MARFFVIAPLISFRRRTERQSANILCWLNGGKNNMKTTDWMRMMGLAVMIVKIANDQKEKNPYKRGGKSFGAYRDGIDDMVQAIAHEFDKLKDKLNEKE
jgi:hypothetical protein